MNKIYSFKADPELVIEQSNYKTGITNNKEQFGVEEDSNYWQLAADYENKKLYFTDITYVSYLLHTFTDILHFTNSNFNFLILSILLRKNYIGLFDVSRKKISKHFRGLAANIEALTRDPVSGNLYWTDSKMGWVVVSDKSLTYYAPVYKTKPYTPYGITVHASKR